MKKNLIYHQMLILLIVFSFVPILIFFSVNYSISHKRVLNEVAEKEVTSLNRLQTNVDEILASIDNVSVQLANYYGQYRFFDNIQNQKYDEIQLVLNVNRSILLTNNYIESIYIYYENDMKILVNDEFYNKNSFFDKVWLESYLNSAEKNNRRFKPIWFYNRYVEKNRAITLVRPFHVSNNPKFGYIVINVSLNKIFEAIPYDQTLVSVFSPDGELIYGTEDGRDFPFGKESVYLDKEKKELFVGSTSTLSKLNYISSVAVKEMFGLLKMMRFQIMVMLLLSFLLIFLSAHLIIKRLYSPLNSFLNYFTERYKKLSFEKKKRERYPYRVPVFDNFIEQQETIVAKIEKEINLSDENKVRKILQKGGDWEIVSEIFGEEVTGFIVMTIENCHPSATSSGENFLGVVKKAIAEIKDLPYCIRECEIDTNIIGCIIGTANDVVEKGTLEQDVKFFAESLMELTTQEKDINIVIGVGEYVVSPDMINTSYEKSVIATKSRILGGETIVFYEEISTVANDDGRMNIGGIELRYIEAIKKRNLQLCEEITEDFTNRLSVEKYSSEYALFRVRIVRDIILSVPVFMGYKTEEIIIQNCKVFYDKISELKNVEEVYTYIIDLCKIVIQGLSVKLTPQHEELITEIKQYIQEHIYEDISLSNLSKKYGVSNSYLSNLFKQQTGEKFIQYVINVKMLHAKQLLLETDITVREISDKLGYFNEKSFYSTFKKSVGCTPTEYRNSSRKENLTEKE